MRKSVARFLSEFCQAFTAFTILHWLMVVWPWWPR